MHDSAAMRSIKCVGNLRGIAQSQIEREPSFLQTRCERLALQILHHHVIGPVLEPTSYRVQMLGCCSAEIARASRLNRWRRSGSDDNAWGMSLTATVRSSRVSRAR